MGNEERRLAQAMEHAMPDVLDEILSAYDRQKEEKPMMKKGRRWLAPLAGLAAALVLSVGLYAGWQNMGRSVVTLDVNPSVSMTVSSREKVTEARGLNADGDTILEGMDLRNVDLKVAVNAVIGAMMQHGYVSAQQNAVLVSVEDKDEARAIRLQAQVSETVSGLFAGAQMEGAVLSQTVAETEELARLAQSLGVSLGKAALIQDVSGQDDALSPEDLAGLAIHEIALLTQSRHLENHVQQDGAPSDRAYIGQERAKEIAVAHAQIAAGDVTAWDVELDSDRGVMVYEVDFWTPYAECEYKINARTGEIVQYEREDKHLPITGVSPDAPEPVGEGAAFAAALADAGVGKSDVQFSKVEPEYDDGRLEKYEVTFEAGGVRYEYDIEPVTGAVLSKETEGNTGNTGYIGEEAAKTAALAHAGLTAGQVRRLRAEFDMDDGVALYEVEFESGGYEYEYEIDALTGAVLQYEVDD